MTNLQLPPDVAMQKKMQAMQQNQLYTLAFQLYAQLLPNCTDTPTATLAAKWCIEAARVFNQVVSEDVKAKENA